MCKKAKKNHKQEKNKYPEMKKRDEINRWDCLGTITNMLEKLKEAEENTTLRRREMNVKNPKWKIWR